MARVPVAPFNEALVPPQRMQARLRTWKAGQGGYVDPAVGPNSLSWFSGSVPRTRALKAKTLELASNPSYDFFIDVAEILSASFVEAVLTRDFNIPLICALGMIEVLLNNTRADPEELRMYNPAAQRKAYDLFPAFLEGPDITPAQRRKFIEKLYYEATALMKIEAIRNQQSTADLTAWRDRMLELAAKHGVSFVDK